MTERYLRRPEVERITTLKTSTLYQYMDEGRFPRPVKISPRVVAWLESEVAEWQRQRLAERDSVEAS